MTFLFRLGFCAPLFLLCGCSSKSPFTHPYSYAPKATNKVWESSSSEKRKIDRVDVETVLEIPSPDEVVALGDLFDIGLLNSPETNKAWQAAREAAASYASSLREYFPQLGLDVYFNSLKTGTVFNGSYFTNEMSFWGPTVYLSYLIWDSGERRQKAELYYQALQSTNWLHNEMIQHVMRTIATAYYEHLTAKAVLEAYEADLMNAESTFVAAQAKQKIGIFDETEVLQAKTSYLQKKVRVTSQIAVTKNTFVDLLSVLGIPGNIEFQLGNFPDSPPMDPFGLTSDQLIELAIENRPDLKSAKADILSQKSSIELAKTELMPKINLTASGGQEWFSIGVSDNGNYNIELDLTVPIFTGFYHLNQIKQKESALGKSKDAFRSKELAIIRETKTAHNTFVSAKQMVIDTKSYLDAATIEFQAMLERYRMGIVDILDVLSAQAFLSDARAQYISSEKEYYMSIIDVAFATGLLTNSCPWTMDIEGKNEKDQSHLERCAHHDD